MILRRLVTALRKQSWLTLVLELVVVVVGIFSRPTGGFMERGAEGPCA